MSHPTDDGTDDDAVVLTTPSRTELASTVRLVAASLGADVGLTVDEIDDVRLAVNEVFASAAEVAPDARVSIAFHPRPGRLDVSIELEDGRRIELDQLADAVLRSVVEVTGRDAGVAFAKRATEAAR